MTQRLLSRGQFEVVHCETPHKLAISVIKRHAMYTQRDRRIHLQDELDRDRAEGIQDVTLVLLGACDFPPDKTSFAASPARRWPAVPVPARHRRLVRRNDFVRRPVLAN